MSQKQKATDDFRKAALSILSNKKEISGSTLRLEINRHLGVKAGIFPFYHYMDDLQNDGLVASQQAVETSRYFSITRAGRRELKAMTAKAAPKKPRFFSLLPPPLANFMPRF